MDHINNKEKEDREFKEMVNNIEVIRVKRRVPAEKEEKQVVKEVKESEKVFPLNPKPKEASKATYAGDYGVKKSLVDTMLKSTPVENNNNNESDGHAKAQHNCIVFFNSVAFGDL